MRTNSLHQLIQSLGQGEWRFIDSELYRATNEAGQIRHRIFLAFTKSEVYDPDLLKKEFQGEYKPARISLEKHKLFNEVCSKLALLNHRQTDHTNLLLGLAECEMLVEKGMQEEALERCFRLIDVATSSDELTLEFQLRELARKILKAWNGREYDAQIDFNHNRLKTLVGQISNLNELRIARDEVQSLVRRFQKTDEKKMLRGFKRIFRRPELQDIRNARSFEAQSCFHSAWRFYYDAIKDEESAYKHGMEMVKLWQINPERSNMRVDGYMASLANVCGALIRLERYAEAATLAQKLKDLELTEPKHKATQFFEYQLKYQLLLLNQAELKKVIENENELLAGIKKYGGYGRMSTVVNLMYNQSLAYMLSDDLGAAVRMFSKVISYKKQNARVYLQYLAIIKRLLLLSWMDDGGSIKHYLRNFNKQFSGQCESLRKLVFEYVSTEWKCETEAEKRRCLTEFTQAVERLMKQQVAGAEEIWIVSKARLEGVPSPQIFRQSMDSKK